MAPLGSPALASAPTTTGRGPALAEVVDLERYPLRDPGSPRLAAAIEQVRAELSTRGCARVEGFVRPGMRDALEAETTRLAPHGQRIRNEITPYIGSTGGSFPQEHPRRRTGTNDHAFVPYDAIPETSVLEVLYRDDAVKAFVADCVGKPEVHELADPIRGLVVNVMSDGDRMAWHFDANEFVVSLMTRRADAGGVFEYCPGIRAPGAENYDEVQDVLDGDRSRVRRLDLRVGDLQLFTGRYSLHRVSEPRGERHCVLFGYAEEPGFVGSVESTRRVYGRVSRAHLEAEGRLHDDGLAD